LHVCHSSDELLKGDLSVAVDVELLAEPVGNGLGIFLLPGWIFGQVEGDDFGFVDLAISVGVNSGKAFGAECSGAFWVSGECENL
jgi:hypothetical protein